MGKTQKMHTKTSYDNNSLPAAEVSKRRIGGEAAMLTHGESKADRTGSEANHCQSCKYNNRFSGLCINVDGPLIGETIRPNDWCGSWEGKKEE